MFGWIIEYIKVSITCKTNQNLGNIKTSIKRQPLNEQTLKINFLLKRYFKNEKKWHINNWCWYEWKVQKTSTVKSKIEIISWWRVGWKVKEIKHAFEIKTWKEK